MRREHQTDGAAYSVGRHLAHGVGEERVPISHPEIDRKVEASLRESLFEAASLSLRDVRERRHAAEMLVVPDDVFEPLGRYATSAQHIAEKRTNIRRALRAAEGDDEHSVKWFRHGRPVASSSRQPRGL